MYVSWHRRVLSSHLEHRKRRPYVYQAVRAVQEQYIQPVNCRMLADVPQPAQAPSQAAPGQSITGPPTLMHLHMP